ncbi:hypothetical protein GF319_12180, partial [Candidatus Bathyarchaeota archaeon]|nr:hypothetical protein [Candidatus Bathyarchaeota archaeon]
MDPENLRNARLDVEAAIEVWTDITSNHLENLEYAYIKGSATKFWQTPIDYVPILSDIDLHIKTLDDKPLFPSTKEGFLSSLKITALYEKLFKSLRSGYLHIPRPQIVTMENLDPRWIPEDKEKIKVLYGEVKPGESRTCEDIRDEDYQSLKELGPVLASLPMMLIDRIGMDYYRIIRSICWRVSPSPIRLLSQTEDPEYVWGLNRTQVHRELENAGYADTAEYYKEYYL